jgi:outer membrane receptor protein involved in Fe transport
MAAGSDDDGTPASALTALMPDVTGEDTHSGSTDAPSPASKSEVDADKDVSTDSKHEDVSGDSQDDFQSSLFPWTRWASFQPAPPILPEQQFLPSPAMPRSAAAADLFGQARRAVGGGTSLSVVSGSEALPRVTSDAGSLLGKSPSAVGIQTQRRTQIVTDPRIRGSRVGQLAAAGSYWVPARIDLDTMLSKIDSRLVDNILVIDGPYSARYGPGFHFIDVELLGSPRYESGAEYHGSTSVDYQTNGQQWHGRQAIWGGDAEKGFRVSYGHRAGENYESGDGQSIPAEYESRECDVALGWDPTADSRVEFSYLRLDQTDVEFPGQAFDMDFLVADAYELRYFQRDQQAYDRLEVDLWYNRTKFAGNAQDPDKRAQFPFFDDNELTMFTDVDSASSGYRVEAAWGDFEVEELRLGADLRHIKQELNEISSGGFGINAFSDVNSPLPRSFTANPGLYAEYQVAWTERFTTTLGARTDWVHADVVDDPAKLMALGTTNPQATLAQILGSGEFDQNFELWSAYLTAAYDLGDGWKVVASGGHGQRPPNLTELYVAESFLFLLQNGQNTATGDPTLRPERLWQVDFGLECRQTTFRGGAKAFYAWAQDYITFENLNVVDGPPFGQVEQVQLKYVNTDLATLVGAELFGEFDAAEWLTPFATLRAVQGTDRTRTGEFATRKVADGGAVVIPSTRVPGLPRGFFSGVEGPDEEPLPAIAPLEARIGARLHEGVQNPRWGLEFTARVADDQDRVAASLLESPTPGFAVYDLRSFWRPRNDLLLVAGVENLGNRNYREHLDFRQTFDGELLRAVFQPGISVYFGGELVY